MTTLKQLAIKHKCDKGAEGHHTYTEFYEQHFSPLRDRGKVRLLEIGVGGYGNPNEGGASLRMWKEYFRDVFIHGIDIENKTAIEEEGILTHMGSQSDPEFLKQIVSGYPSFDIVIDDGSHVTSDVITSFQTIFPLLPAGAIYVIEDTQTSYWKHYRKEAPQGHIEFFKKFIDGLHYKEIATEQRGEGINPPEPSYMDMNILSIHFYHNMVFIYKGDNTLTA